MNLFSQVHRVCRATILAWLALCVPGLAQSTPAVLSLNQARLVEPIGRGGESYALRLESDQFARIVLEQQGVDVLISLLSPAGTVLCQVDAPSGANGDEFLFIAAGEPGEYQVNVIRHQTNWANQATNQGGSYRIELTELRALTTSDALRQSTQQIASDALQSVKRETAESLKLALTKYQDVLLNWRTLGETRLEIQTLIAIGLIHLEIGEVVHAADHYQQALDRGRAPGGSQQDLALALGNLAYAHQLMGDWRQALDRYQEYLQFLDRFHDVHQQALTLSSIGSIHVTLGDPQTALNYYDRALRISRERGLSRIEGMSLGKIGSVLFSMGEFQQALNSFQLALRLHRESHDPSGQAVTLNYIGQVHLALGEYPKALEFFQQTLEIGIRTGNRALISQARNYIGQTLLLQGKHQAATREFQEALQISKADGRRPGTNESLSNLGAAEKAAGHYAPALGFFQQSLELSKRIGERRQEALNLVEIGDLLASRGELDRAAENFQFALDLSRTLRDPRLEANTRYQLARLAERRGDLPGARSHIREAINIVETLRTKFLQQDMRAAFLGRVHAYYQLSMRTLMKMSRRPDDEFAIQALQVNEMARARGMLELITESRADIRRGAPAGLIRREKDLRIKIGAKRDLLMRLANQSESHPATQKEMEAIQQEISALNDELGNLEAQIRQESPAYAALTQPRPLQLAEIQRQVIEDDDTLLLEYALGEEASYLWLVSRNSIESHRLPGRAEIERHARALLSLLRGRPQGSAARRKAQLDQFAQAAQTLSRMVIGPVASQLGARRLIVVSDGILQYVPFATLSIPQSGAEGLPAARTASASGYVPLLTKHEIIGLPSATTLAVLRKELKGREEARYPVAVLADPVFGKYDDRVPQNSTRAAGAAPALATVSGSAPKRLAGEDEEDEEQEERSSQSSEPKGGPKTDPKGPSEPGKVWQPPAGQREPRLARLTNSRDEAEAIMKLAPAGSMVALDFDASRELIESKRMSEYRILHFALHGIIDDEKPEQSALVFSRVDERGESKNGMLYLNEIYTLKLPAELVVLSACQTGLGHEINGEGIMGWTRGFMHAGARRVVASLWKVNDAATAELMKRFYQGMLRDPRLTPSAALRQAQLAIWKETKWQAPYFWAPFVLQGEW